MKRLFLSKKIFCARLKSMKSHIVRFAPSPTGYLHVGSLRTALYNYLIARQSGGRFILRVEDTDQKRYVSGAVESLIKTLALVGLNYDEGPLFEDGKIIERGNSGPYLQSQRTEIYRKYAQELIDKDLAYYCFCDEKVLEEMKSEQEKHKEAPRYDGRCRNLSASEVADKIKAGLSYVIRLKIPQNETVTFTDEIRGEISFNTSTIDDQVLIKSDGFPTYHLANVVDDHLMGVTLVIRGDEWLPSTPKHILLYKNLGWNPPQFAHLPLILNPDKTKLSKRQGDVAVEDYLNKGYLPEALINFIAFLGWNPGDEREIFSLEELVKEFSLVKVGKAGAVFNLEKLDWLNGHYLRQLSPENLISKCLPYFEKKIRQEFPEEYLKKIILLQQERLKKFSDVNDGIEFFFKDKLDYSAEMLIWKKSTAEETLKNLSLLEEIFNQLSENDFNLEKLNTKILPLAQERGVGSVMWPLRVALSGQQNSPGPLEIASILGKEKTLSRLKIAQELLKG